MEKAAILHCMDQNYSFMNGKGEYVFRIRVKKDDAKKVILHGRDKYIHMLKSSDKRCMEMTKVATDGLVDYYEVALTLDMVCFRYFFELFDENGENLYYGNYTFWEKKPKEIRQMFDCPLKSKEEDRFLVPEWAKLSSSNHKYDTTDYYTIDPGFGTKEDLQELVKKARALGMYVVLDGVFNHTATNFFAFEDLKKNGETSVYKEWYIRKIFR